MNGPRRSRPRMSREDCYWAVAMCLGIFGPFILSLVLVNMAGVRPSSPKSYFYTQPHDDPTLYFWANVSFTVSIVGLVLFLGTAFVVERRKRKRSKR